MKTRLLKKLRSIGRNQIHITSTTTTGGTYTGMGYSYNDSVYSSLWFYSMTPEELIEKACKVYLKTNIEEIRKRYKKYSRRNKQA